MNALRCERSCLANLAVTAHAAGQQTSDPKPDIRVHALSESSVDFAVRPWVKTGVYWEAYGALTKAVKIAFDKEGISIPFPQRDVHVIEKK